MKDFLETLAEVVGEEPSNIRVLHAICGVEKDFLEIPWEDFECVFVLDTPVPAEMYLVGEKDGKYKLIKWATEEELLELGRLSEMRSEF